LKKIRATFLEEITENNLRITAKMEVNHFTHFEKDDVLDCLIYCIVKGEISGISQSLRALMSLLGESDLLSNKGVDSYRADLQGAAQYL
jgi:hypothetical protein